MFLFFTCVMCRMCMMVHFLDTYHQCNLQRTQQIKREARKNIRIIHDLESSIIYYRQQKKL